jgi:hypothetical protein
MSTEANKALVIAFLDTISKSDLTGASAMIHDDVTWWSAGGENLQFSGVLSKAAFLESMRAQSGLFSKGLTLTPTGMVAEDDRVAVEMSGHAVTSDGRDYDNLYHSVFTLKDNQIVAVKEYHDTLYAKVVLVDGKPSNSPK